MSKLSENFFRQDTARRASKAATDALWSQGDGTSAYNLMGKIYIGCGVGWILISFIPIACKTPVSECIWMWIFAAIQIIPGIILVILSKKSKRFQKWADKNFEKGLKTKEKLESKVKVGNVTLPMTYGEVLVFTILGIIILIIIVLCIIG